MKKFLTTLCLFLLLTPLMLATQTFVLAENFTQTWCGFCPAARSALNQMYQNSEQFPYLIPIIWQGNGPHQSPNYGTRQSLYGFTGIPHARFNGNIEVRGGGANVYTNYSAAYGGAVNRVAPMTIDIRMSINQHEELVVAADVQMTGNITTTNNNIIFVLTYDLTGIMDPDYFASAKTYFAQSFPLNSEGEQQTFTRNHAIDPTWEMERISAIVFVQSLVSANPIVHQAAMKSFDKLNTMFSSNVQQGPPSLHVQFHDNSMSANQILSWEWDLTGDGEIDSIEKDPYFVYDEPGTYTVTLTVYDGEEIGKATMENYITVQEPDSVEGLISGVFHKEFAPYRIVGNVTIPDDGFLKIEPGVEIEIEDAFIQVRGPLTADAEEDEPIVFTSNSTWKGLQLHNNDNDNVIKNCIFTKATENALRVSNSRAVIVGNTFHNNSAVGANAGALKIISTNNIVLRNNIFANNQSVQGVGAVEIEAASFNITNNLFVNNTGNIAAALFIKLGSSTDLINNTIANNSHNAPNGFHILNSSSYVQIRNCIIRGEGNILSSLSGSLFLSEYSNISGGTDGVHIIDSDPMFVQPSEGNGVNYDGLNAIWHLDDNSPSIDAGNPSPNYNDPEDPNNPGFALFPAKGTLRNDLGTYGGSNSGYWVSVDDEYLVQKPIAGFSITAYPNPFNPEVTISLANIPYDNNEPVSLSIYNTKGQLVKTIIDNSRTTQREFYWKGIDNNNKPVTSGVYLINFTSGKMTSNQKILLLK